MCNLFFVMITNIDLRYIFNFVSTIKLIIIIVMKYLQLSTKDSIIQEIIAFSYDKVRTVLTYRPS